MNPKLGHPVKNKNKVPMKQWRKWSNHAKKVFNDMYHALRPTMQQTITHPDALPLPKEHWQTLRWNAAWIAASGVEKSGGAAATLRGQAPNKDLRAFRARVKRKVAKVLRKRAAKKAVRKPKGKRRGR